MTSTLTVFDLRVQLEKERLREAYKNNIQSVKVIESIVSQRPGLIFHGEEVEIYELLQDSLYIFQLLRELGCYPSKYDKTFVLDGLDSIRGYNVVRRTE